MTFKAKSVLQRQWCNAWTEFRGCVLQGDLRHTVSRQEKRSPHISCCTNRVSHLLFSGLFLQILMEWLRQNCTDSLMPSNDCHIYPTARGISGTACLFTPCLHERWLSEAGEAQCLCLLCCPLSSPQGVLFIATWKDLSVSCLNSSTATKLHA